MADEKTKPKKKDSLQSVLYSLNKVKLLNVYLKADHFSLNTSRFSVSTHSAWVYLFDDQQVSKKQQQKHS